MLSVPSPFPGMDPYLEQPGLWPGFHNRLIAALDEDLSDRLPDRYYVSLEERIVVAEPPAPDFVGRPDAAVIAAGAATSASGAPRTGTATASAPVSAGVQVLTAELPMPDHFRDTYLEVRESETDEIVTVVEVLSPSNKRPGADRRQYEAKRLHTLGTLTSLVEIDLLRGGDPMPMRLKDWPAGAPPPGDYRILVAREGGRPWAELFAFDVRGPIPPIRLPLRAGDEEPAVDLQTLVHTVYNRSRYSLRINYRAEPVPRLRPEDAAWADALLRARGLR